MQGQEARTEPKKTEPAKVQGATPYNAHAHANAYGTQGIKTKEELPRLTVVRVMAITMTATKTMAITMMMITMTITKILTKIFS